MGNLKVYEDWESGENDEEQIGFINALLNDKGTRENIERHFRTRGMSAEFQPEDTAPQEFVIEYKPTTFGGEVPSRISYYIDDLSEILSEILGPEVSWSFSPGGNCQRIIFRLDKPIDPRYFKVKKILRDYI